MNHVIDPGVCTIPSSPWWGICPPTHTFTPWPEPVRLPVVAPPPGRVVVGVCSLCGDQCSSPGVWSGTMPPPVTCDGCGAERAEEPDLPVIPMRPRREVFSWSMGVASDGAITTTWADGESVTVGPVRGIDGGSVEGGAL